MKLDAFIRLPLSFEAERLRAEVEELSEDWRGDTRGREGSVLPLLAPGGRPDDGGAGEPIAPTAHLNRCEYLREALAGLGTVLGRTRLVRLGGGREVPLDNDDAYYW